MSAVLPQPAAVLFDCDGVLVDSEEITNRLLRDDLAGRGLDLPLDQIMTLSVGGTMEGVADAARQRGAILPDDWVDQFYKVMFAGLEREVEPIQGVSNLLNHLIAADIKIAVGSNGPRAKMDITLRRTGLMDRLFPHIYSARDLNHPKPAPDVYLHAAQQLGAAPGACVVVEDSASGAKAAVAAGMPCIGFAPAHIPRDQVKQLARHCDVVVADMAALPVHLGL